MAWICRLVLACSCALIAHTLPPDAAPPATNAANGSGVAESFENVSGTGEQHLEQEAAKPQDASDSSAKQPGLSSLQWANASKEDALLCPHGFCKQPKPMPAGWIAEEVLDHPEMYGPASLFRECAQKTNLSMIVPVTAWGRSQGLELKQELETNGYHMEWCPLERAGALWDDTIAVYTEEQQERLGVDQYGNWFHPEL